MMKTFWIICAGLLAMPCLAGEKARLVYPANDNCEKTESPRHTFVVESYGLRADHNWIVRRSGTTLRRWLCHQPPTPEVCAVTSSTSPQTKSAILMDQKLYHGANACWLYHREKPL